jgi:hypothetical protein
MVFAVGLSLLGVLVALIGEQILGREPAKLLQCGFDGSSCPGR